MEITRENLEEVINQFAATIIQRKGIELKPYQFMITLDDDIPNDIVMHAGNPVRIKIRFSVFAQAFIKRQLADFKYQLESSLRVAPRMLRSLAVVPVSPHLVKDMDSRKWKKRNKIVGLPPRIPSEDIKIVTQTSVTAIYKPTGQSVTVTGETVAAWKLAEQAEEALCRLVDNSKEDESDDNGQSNGVHVQDSP